MILNALFRHLATASDSLSEVSHQAIKCLRTNLPISLIPVTQADIWLAKNVMQWTHRENGWVDLEERFMASDAWSPSWDVSAARQVLTEFLAAFDAPHESARTEWPSWRLVAEVDPLLAVTLATRAYLNTELQDIGNAA